MKKQVNSMLKDSNDVEYSDLVFNKNERFSSIECVAKTYMDSDEMAMQFAYIEKQFTNLSTH